MIGGHQGKAFGYGFRGGKLPAHLGLFHFPDQIGNFRKIRRISETVLHDPAGLSSFTRTTAVIGTDR